MSMPIASDVVRKDLCACLGKVATISRAAADEPVDLHARIYVLKIAYSN